MITDEELAQALDRIARTPDGEALYRYCQKKLMGTIAEHDPSDSALRGEHGMRRFAAELMAHMRKGIEDSGGSSSSDGSDGTDGKRTERLVIFASRQPVTSGKHRDARSYLRDNDPEYARIASGDGTGR